MRRFAERIASAARALKSRLGVGRGDRVGILAANHPDYLVLLYACAPAGGAMLLPLNWRLAPPEQVFILSDASVKALIVEDAFAAVLAPLKEALPDIPRRRSRQSARAEATFDALLAEGSGDGAIRTSTKPAAAARLHLRHHAAPRARCCARRRCCGTA